MRASLPLRPLQAEPFSSAATKIRTGRVELLRRGLAPLRRLFTWDYAAFVTSCPRLRPQRSFCRRAVLHRHDDCAASIRKSGPEIKNRCTQEGVNGEKHASIPKFGLEIKNRCTKEGVIGEKLASIPKFGLEIKNPCTQEGVNGEKLASIPEFGLEIKNRCTQEGVNGEKHASILKSGLEIKKRCSLWAVLEGFFTSIPKSGPEIKNRCRKQHIPRHAFHRAPKHASCLGCFAWGRARAGSIVAAKVGADASGGGISLCFCRRGCAAPAQKAATPNVPPPLRQSKKRMTSADVILFDL